MSFRDRPLRDRRRSEKERRIAFRLSGRDVSVLSGFFFFCVWALPFETCGKTGRRCSVFRRGRMAKAMSGFPVADEDRAGSVADRFCAEDMPVAASRWRRGVCLSSGVRSGERGRRFRCSAVPEASLGRRWGRSGVCPGVFSFRGDGCPFRRAAGSVRRGGEYAFGNGPAVGCGLRRVFRIGSAGCLPTEWGRLAAVADDAGTEKSRPKPGFFRKGICPSARNGKVNR